MARAVGQLAASQFANTRLLTLVVGGTITGVASLMGIASGLGYGLLAASVAVTAVSLAIAAWNWRLVLLALLALVAYTGIPSILLYPNVGPAALIKDVFLVIPLYVAFLTAVVSRRLGARRLRFSITPLVFFACWVLAESLNPLLPSPLVALVGIRVWLLYIPLAFVTAYFIRTRDHLERLLTVLVVAGAPPAIFGIIQAALVASGHADIAYAVYGFSAEGATQGFTQFQVESGGVIARIPSTFSFAGQYFGFTLTYIAATYARWRLAAGSTWRQRWAAMALLVAILAALTSGSRGAFLLVPAILLLTVVLERRISLRRILVVTAVTAIFTTILAAIGLSVPSLIQLVVPIAVQEFDYLIVQGFGNATQLTILGLGTGVDTGASRYVLEGGDLFAATGGQWYESWYVKIWLELGVVGLALVAGVVWSIVRAAGNAFRAAPDDGVRATTAVVSAFLLVNLVYNIKGAYVDVDPVNVLFWVFVGVLIAIGSGLATEQLVAGEAVPRPGPAPRASEVTAILSQHDG